MISPCHLPELYHFNNIIWRILVIKLPIILFFRHHISFSSLGRNILVSTLFWNATASSWQITLSFSQQSRKHYKIYRSDTEAFELSILRIFLIYRCRPLKVTGRPFTYRVWVWSPAVPCASRLWNNTDVSWESKDNCVTRGLVSCVIHQGLWGWSHEGDGECVEPD